MQSFMELAQRQRQATEKSPETCEVPNPLCLFTQLQLNCKR